MDNIRKIYGFIEALGYVFMITAAYGNAIDKIDTQYMVNIIVLGFCAVLYSDSKKHQIWLNKKEN